jgi:hypothetical protein
MPPIALRILVVGNLFPAARDILRRFSERGWGSQHVGKLSEAGDLLGMLDYEVVLSSECLIDGRGYELADSVAAHSRTLIVGVALSESQLWLPVVERGAHVLGKRGLSAQMLELELTNLLDPSAPGKPSVRVTEFPRKQETSVESPPPHRSTMMRRKYRDRDHLPLGS